MHEALNVPLLLCHERFNEATTSRQLAYQYEILVHNKNAQYAKYVPHFNMTEYDQYEHHFFSCYQYDQYD